MSVKSSFYNEYDIKTTKNVLWAQRSFQNHHQTFHDRCPEKIWPLPKKSDHWFTWTCPENMGPAPTWWLLFCHGDIAPTFLRYLSCLVLLDNWQIFVRGYTPMSGCLQRPLRQHAREPTLKWGKWVGLSYGSRQLIPLGYCPEYSGIPERWWLPRGPGTFKFVWVGNTSRSSFWFSNVHGLGGGDVNRHPYSLLCIRGNANVVLISHKMSLMSPSSTKQHLVKNDESRPGTPEYEYEYEYEYFIASYKCRLPFCFVVNFSSYITSHNKL